MKFLKQHGINAITLFAILLLGFLGFVPIGQEFSRNLMETSPALFYWGLGSFFLGTFSVWVAFQIKKRWK